MARRIAAEALATAGLLVAVIGSGIMGERLSGGIAGIALLANTLATGCALAVLILVFGPISGAHMNPLITLIADRRERRPISETLGVVAAQVAGAFSGAAAANLMFGLPAWFVSTHARAGWNLGFSEAIATFGLVLVVLVLSQRRPGAIPFAVAAYIMAAYWFTSSTSFANPAATLARAATDTFAGIRPADVPVFLLGQALGAGLAVFVATWFPVARAGEAART